MIPAGEVWSWLTLAYAVARMHLARWWETNVIGPDPYASLAPMPMDDGLVFVQGDSPEDVADAITIDPRFRTQPTYQRDGHEYGYGL